MAIKDILYALSYVSDEYIIQTEQTIIRKRKQLRVLKVCIAACLCVLLCPAAIYQIGEHVFSNQEIAAVSQDIAEEIEYNGERFFIMGEIEKDVLKASGLPAKLTEDLAGDHAAYLEYDEDRHLYVVSDEVTEIELFEYAPEETENVYIVYRNGKYLAAIRNDEEGMHGINGQDYLDGEAYLNSLDD